MGRSRTYNLIALTEEGEAYPCLNKTELAQMIVKAKKNATPITKVYAQTKVGVRMIKSDIYVQVPIEEVKLPKLIPCPICEGQGETDTDYCTVCRGSGITQNGHWTRWSEWQLEEMKKKFPTR